MWFFNIYTRSQLFKFFLRFLTYTPEANYLNSSYGQEIIASALFRAFRAFVQAEHPSIEFINSEEELVENGVVFKIQIMSSIEPVDLDISEFKMLDTEVERVKVESKSIYKYRYFVGKFETKKETKTLLKQIRENGFPDAYVVKLE